MTTEQRNEELISLLATLEELCSKYNLRLGQVIQLALSKADYNVDLFDIENGKLEELIQKI